MAASGVSSDGALPSGSDFTSADTGAGDNDSAPMNVDENGALLSMGPLLPANPEDTTCYWYVSHLFIHNLVVHTCTEPCGIRLEAVCCTG